MKTPSLQLTACVCLAAFLTTPLYPNDLFHLKDGRVLEGTILDDRADSYLLEVQVTRSIKDEIVVAKEDIQRIDRTSPDGPAFAAIQPLVPIPDLLSAEDYAARIRSIEKFIETYPDSDSITDAKKMLDAHLAEVPTIQAGGIKFKGKLLSSTERHANAYEIDSRVAQAAIQQSIHNGSLLFTLRQFHEFEKDFTESCAWRELLPLMRQVAASHQNTARRMREEYDTLIEQQQIGLGRMGHDDRNNATRAIAEREASLQSRYDQERSNQNSWLSIHPYFRPALDDTIRFADQEIRRLESAIDRPAPEPTLSDVWQNAVASIQSGDQNAARTAIATARSARISSNHLSKLEELAANTE